MKRDAFLLEHYEREATYDEWARAVLARPGEAPYELLRVWRHAYGVPADAPYVGVRLEMDNYGGFLLANERNDTVLLYARAGHVTLHHETLPPAEYAGWSKRSRGWPWCARAPPENSLVLLPTEVWRHFAHLLCSRKSCVARFIAFVCAPLCKKWVCMWDSPRMALDGFYKRQADVCDIYRAHHHNHKQTMWMLIVRRTLNLFEKALDGTLGNQGCDMLVQEYGPSFPIITSGRYVYHPRQQKPWTDTLVSEPGGRRAWMHHAYDLRGLSCVLRITCAEELFSILIRRVPFEDENK